MRLALKIAYDGTLYHGYADQPGIATIEGTISKKLEDMGAIEDKKKARLQVASRTDRGVSAAGNVIAFDTVMAAESVARGLAHILRGIWIAGFAKVPDNFNPRHTESKMYRYYLYNEGLDIDAVKSAVNMFVGKHDFTNFARLDGRNPVRTITSARVSTGKILKIDFEGKSFLWNQVRRMVAAAERAGRNEISPVDIKDALEMRCKKNFGVAPPENLLLAGMAYSKNMNFQRVEETKEFVSGMLRKIELKGAMTDDIIRFL